MCIMIFTDDWGDQPEVRILMGLGIVETPQEIVERMVSLLNINTEHSLDILEPACGCAPFLQCIEKQVPGKHKLQGVDIRHAAIDCAKRNVPNAYFEKHDFLLWYTNKKFDIIIGNPPYGVVRNKTDESGYLLAHKRKLYRQISKTWFAAYNIYGAFIEKSINMLKEDGELVFIVPAGFLVLDDFSKLREFMAVNGNFDLYYVGNVFKGNNISCVILHFIKKPLTIINTRTVVKLYNDNELINEYENYNGELIRFENEYVLSLERGNPKIKDYFDIRFAPRTNQYKAFAGISREPELGYLPVLTGRNLRKGWIDYETCYSKLWIKPGAVGGIVDA